MKDIYSIKCGVESSTVSILLVKKPLNHEKAAQTGNTPYT